MYFFGAIKRTALAGLLCGLLFSSLTARGQNITGQINGTVRDVSGAVVVGATVTVTNTDTQEVVRTLKTGKSGEYTASLLQIGTYTITAQAPGFGEEQLTDISVDVGASVTRDFRLVAGSKAEITVNASGLTPNTKTNENSTVIDNTEMQELALNTRNFQQILLLQPGVSYGGSDELPTGQVDPSGARNSHQLSINGLQPSQVLFTLDGADMLNHTSNGQVSVFPSVGAINQTQTIRNNYGAQYGGGGGAQVTIATKAGASDYHGEAYFFYRNAGLNATPFQNLLTTPVTPKPDIHYDNYGYDIGGPVIIPKLLSRSHSKTFFFFAQEFRRIDNPTSRQAGNIPTLANTYGYFKSAVCVSLNSAGKCDNTQTRAVAVTNSPFPGLNYRICVADDPIACPVGAPMADPVASAYMKDVFRPSTLLAPAPIDPAKPNNVILSQNSPTSETQELGRIDHQFGERLSGFVRVIYDPITQSIPNSLYSAAGDPGVSTTTVKSYGANYLAHLTWTARPNTVLEFGASYLPYQTQATPTGFAVAANSPDIHVNLPFANTTGRVPTIVLVNSNNVGAVGPLTDKSETYQLFENTTHTVGRHVIYFGGNIEHLTDSANVGTTNAGVFNFSTPASGGNSQFDQSFGILLGGNATTFTQASVDPHSHPDENLYELYVQDNWRATATFTVNAGLRYSIYQAPGDYSDDTSGTNAFPQGKLGGFQAEAYNPAFAPTIGYDGSICTTGNKSVAACAGLPINANYNTLNGGSGRRRKLVPLRAGNQPHTLAELRSACGVCLECLWRWANVGARRLRNLLQPAATDQLSEHDRGESGVCAESHLLQPAIAYEPGAAISGKWRCGKYDHRSCARLQAAIRRGLEFRCAAATQQEHPAGSELRRQQHATFTRGRRPQPAAAGALHQHGRDRMRQRRCYGDMRAYQQRHVPLHTWQRNNKLPAGRRAEPYSSLSRIRTHQFSEHTLFLRLQRIAGVGCPPCEEEPDVWRVLYVVQGPGEQWRPTERRFQPGTVRSAKSF